jgi:crossover junction endodeoxyribonuclease RusA
MHVLVVPGQLVTANALRRSHWAASAATVARWRHDTRLAALASGIPPQTRISIDIRPAQARGRLADAGAHEPAAKAAIDGLVDAHIIPDDTGRHITRITYLAPTRSEMRMAGQLVDHLTLIVRGE